MAGLTGCPRGQKATRRIVHVCNTIQGVQCGCHVREFLGLSHHKKTPRAFVCIAGGQLALSQARVSQGVPGLPQVTESSTFTLAYVKILTWKRLKNTGQILDRG